MSRYDEIIKPWGLTVLHEWDQDDYQGSSVVIFQKGRRYGFLEYSWGSCSGCDSLEAACGDKGAIAELSDSLKDSIKWFNNRESLVAHLDSYITKERADNFCCDRTKATALEEIAKQIASSRSLKKGQTKCRRSN